MVMAGIWPRHRPRASLMGAGGGVPSGRRRRRSGPRVLPARARQEEHEPGHRALEQQELGDVHADKEKQQVCGQLMDLGKRTAFSLLIVSALVVFASIGFGVRRN